MVSRFENMLMVDSIHIIHELKLAFSTVDSMVGLTVGLTVDSMVKDTTVDSMVKDTTVSMVGLTVDSMVDTTVDSTVKDTTVSMVGLTVDSMVKDSTVDSTMVMVEVVMEDRMKEE